MKYITPRCNFIASTPNLRIVRIPDSTKTKKYTFTLPDGSIFLDIKTRKLYVINMLIIADKPIINDCPFCVSESISTSKQRKGVMPINTAIVIT